MTGVRMTKTRGIIALLVAAGLLWIVAERTWIPDTSGTASAVPGVAQTAAEAPADSPVLLACAGVVAVCALLLGLLGSPGRRVVSAVALLASLGYGATALVTVLGSASHTAWPVAGLALGVAVAAVAGWVGWSSGRWHASARYDRHATGDGADGADGEETDPARTWDALSRGEDL